MKDEHYVGTAPLLITVDPGLYKLVIVVPISEIESAGFDVLSADEPLERFEFDGNDSHGMTYDNGEPDLFYKTYTLEKRAGEYEALVTILLPVPEDELEHTVPYLYPSLNMVGFLPKRYNVDEQGVTEAITDTLFEYGLTAVSSAMVKEMVQILYRVGKVVLRTEKIKITINMWGLDTQSFSMKIVAYK